MTPRPLTDAQLAAGLRAHLPVARAGLRERILAEITATPQERRLASILGRLTDADPIARRRMTLLVALAALALSIWVAAVAGALLREQRTPDLSLDPPDDVDAFVLASYGRIVELPAFKLVHSPDGGPVTRYHYDGKGALREAAPGPATIFTADFIARRESIGGRPIWVVSQGDWGHSLSRIAGLRSGPLNCPTGWEHVEVTYLIERPTHHVRCVTEDERDGTLERHQWIDIDTGLVLRSGSPVFQATGSGSFEPLGLVFDEVIELEFAPQPAELFVVDGETMPADQWACDVEGACVPQWPPTANPAATPIVTPPPAEAAPDVPGDLQALIAGVRSAYETLEPVEIRIDAAHHPELRHVAWIRWQHDGHGSYRAEHDLVPNDGRPGVVWLTAGGRAYETDPRPDGRTWRDWGPRTGPWGTPTLGLPEACGPGWLHLGFDRVLDRPAHHLQCGFQEFWIDAEWLFVTRAHDHDPMLGDDPAAGLSEVTSITFGPQPGELFEAPAPDDIWSQ